MATYELRTEDGYCERFIAASDEAARGKALDSMSDAAFDLSGGTVWFHGDLFKIIEEETEDLIDHLTYTFDPPEPDCDGEHDHDWQSPYSVVGGIRDNPGVWGHGGGVIIREVCAHCGRYKVTDTWAQDPSTGEEGLEAVWYEDADSASTEWVASLQGECAEHP